MGQRLAHSPHPMHFSGVTRAFAVARDESSPSRPSRVPVRAPSFFSMRIAPYWQASTELYGRAGGSSCNSAAKETPPKWSRCLPT